MLVKNQLVSYLKSYLLLDLNQNSINFLGLKILLFLRHLHKVVAMYKKLDSLQRGGR